MGFTRGGSYSLPSYLAHSGRPVTHTRVLMHSCTTTDTALSADFSVRWNTLDISTNVAAVYFVMYTGFIELRQLYACFLNFGHSLWFLIIV